MSEQKRLTVKELIVILKEYKPDSEIVFRDGTAEYDLSELYQLWSTPYLYCNIKKRRKKHEHKIK